MNLYGAPPPLPGRVRGRNNATDTTDKELIATPGNSLALNITQVVIFNAHASAGTGVSLKSGTATIYGPIPAPGNKGGCVLRFDPPLECAEDEAFQFAAEDAVSTIYVSALGYKAAPTTG